MARRIQENLIDIVENHRVPPLPDKTLQALFDIQRKGEKELVAQAQ
jgi:hypothetical protein